MSDAAFTLTQAQLDHAAAVYKLAGVNPVSNTLRYSMMDDGTGTGRRRLTLYATKGFTNAVRDSKNISVVEMTHSTVGTAFAVTAKAKNDAGRTDIAMGAVSIENKTGRALENAIAAAQTKATRRVTLQIAGLDIIDESEVPETDKTVALESVSVPLSEISQPTEISQELGTDVTEEAPIEKPKTNLAKELAAKLPDPPAEKKLPNPAAGLALSSANLPAPNGQEVPKEAGKVRKPRRKKNQPEETVSAPSAPVPTVPIELLAPDAKVVNMEAPEVAPVSKPAQSATVVGNMPTAPQMKHYVDRLIEYRTKILPEGGMVASFGMGIPKKLRSFVTTLNGGKEDATKYSVEEWDKTFKYLDDEIAKNGVKSLINIIEFNVTGEATNAPTA